MSVQALIGSWIALWGSSAAAQPVDGAPSPAPQSVENTELADVLELEVVTETPAPAAVSTALDMRAVRTMPGALGDPLRSLQTQAGIGRAPFGLAVLLVRGQGARDQAAWFGEVRLPRAMHFGGLGSIIDPVLLDSVQVVHAATRSRYGDSLGAAVVLEPSHDLHPRVGAEFSVDLLQARAVGWAPLPGKTELTVAARRSWIDLAVAPFIEGRAGLTQLPATQDGAVRVQHHGPSSNARWQAMVLGATDRLGESDGERTDDAYDAWLLRGLLQSVHDVGSTGSIRTGWSVGPDSRLAQSTIPLGVDAAGLFDEEEDAGVREDRFDARGRVVAEGEAGPVLLEGGAEAAVGSAEFWLGEVDGVPDDVVESRSGGSWSEVGLRLGPVVPVVGGRVDSTTIGTWSAVTADPRARVEVSAPARLRFVGAVGTAHQAPDDREVVSRGEGRPLQVEQAVHGSLTAEQSIGSTQLRLTGFVAALDALVVGNSTVYRFDDPPLPGPPDKGRWRNEGEGRTRGVEASLTLTEALTAVWLSASYVRSDRREDDGDWHPWAWEQPWSANAVVTRVVGAFQFGTRVRAGSGLPYTPVVNGAVHAETGDVLPVFGSTAEARLSPFWSVDARVDWTTDLRHGGEFGVFVDVQNATARDNEEVVAWSSDWRHVTPVLGLPILPTAGFRGVL